MREIFVKKHCATWLLLLLVWLVVVFVGVCVLCRTVGLHEVHWFSVGV